MRFISSILIITFALFANSLYASDVNNKNANTSIVENFGNLYHFDSKVLAEKRELMIYLPQDYPKAGVQYPVLYVLDGENHFKHAVLATENLHLGSKMPQAIIVGIPNNTGNRLRDSFDKRDNFIAFIKDEVMTYVDTNYNSSGRNILFGHSLMGLLTLNVFADHNGLFNQYIASSPAVDHTNTDLFSQLERLFSQNKLSNQSIYFSVGEKSREGLGFTDGAIYLSQLFTEKSPKALAWHYDFLAGQNHTTTAYLAIFKGLNTVFSDYEPPALANYEEFKKNGGLKGINEFFTRRGDKYKDGNVMPQQYLVSLAFTFMGQGDFEHARILLLESEDKYSDPVRIFGALGYLYEQIKEQPQALKAYQRALALAKDEPPQLKLYYQNRINELQQ